MGAEDDKRTESAAVVPDERGTEDQPRAVAEAAGPMPVATEDFSAEKTPTRCLAEFQSSGSPDAASRDTVVVVHSELALRRAVGRILSKTFPGYKMAEFSDGDTAIEALRGELGDRVAVILNVEVETLLSGDLARDEDGSLVSALSGAKALDLSRVPIIAGPTRPRSTEETNQPALVSAGRIDAVLPLPFSLERFNDVLTTAIQRRIGLFQEVEEAAMSFVLREFVDQAKALIHVWKKMIQGLSFFPGAEDEAALNSKESDAKEIICSLENSELLIVKLENLLAKANGLEMDFGRLPHDIANKIAPAVMTPDFILDECGDTLSSSDKATIERFHQEIQAFNNCFSLIRRSIRREGTWTTARRDFSESVMAPDAKLVLPGGIKVCVVDDDEGIKRVCERMIGYAGGVAVSASDEASIRELAESEEDTDVRVFLLDNDLGGELRGHQLIELIRENWPDALIIAHTGDESALNQDSNNPYKAAEVEIVGKRDWRAISGIVRRKLPKLTGPL